MKTITTFLTLVAMAVIATSLQAHVPPYLLDGNESSQVVWVLEGSAAATAWAQMQRGAPVIVTVGQKDDPQTGKRWEKRRHIKRVEAHAPDGSVMQVILGPAHWVEAFSAAPSTSRVNNGYAWLEHYRNGSYQWQAYRQRIVHATNEWRAWSQRTGQQIPPATRQTLQTQLQTSDAWIQWFNAQATALEQKLRSAAPRQPVPPAPPSGGSSGNALGGIV